MLFYIILGLTYQSEAQCELLFFCLFQCFAEKEYQTESKWNETFARIFYVTKAIQETWSGGQ